MADPFPLPTGRDDRLPQPIRGVMLDAIAEAQRRGATTVGPEHLLLAMVLDEASPAAAVLAEFGLDHAALDAALDAEAAASLAVVGIDKLDPRLVDATARPGRPAWASATRDVFRRAQSGGARRRRLTAELSVLYGILTANFGTVPRALAYAGVDHDALIGRVERERIAAEAQAPRTGAHQGVSAQERQALRREAVRRAQAQRRDALREAQRARRAAQGRGRAPTADESARPVSGASDTDGR